MRLPDAGEVLRALHEMLDRESKLIRCADFAGLAAESAEKERLMDLLTRAKAPTPKALERLRGQAERNRTLMEAALKGVRSARRRFDALCKAQSGLTTYDTQGRSRDISATPASVERRA